MKSKSHSFQFIENVGPNSLINNLRQMTKGANRVDIAVAFISSSGLHQLLPSLQQVAAHGEVRILTGLYQGITDPRALRTLLRVQEQTRERLSVRISRESKFHRKLYMVRAGSRVRAVVGSSNLTNDGLSSGGELNVYISSAASSAPMRQMLRAFNDDWEDHSVPLDEGIIGRYAQTDIVRQQRAAQKSISLRSILGAGTTSRRAKDERQESPISFWRDGVNYYVSKQTEAVIASTTNWDERGYSWYAAGSHKFKSKDRILMFDFTRDFVQVVQVVDCTRTAVRTPDGVHFVAYKPVRREKARRLTPSRWRKLKAALGVTRRSEFLDRHKLSPEHWSLAHEALRAR